MNFRILGLVLFFLVIAFVGVVAVRSAKITYFWVEQIAPNGSASVQPVENGLSLIVRGDGLGFTIPNCATQLYSENFFLHVYPNTTGDYFNLDFELGDLKKKKVRKWGKTFCIYKKAWNIQAQKVVVGQFDMPNDHCCRILWSRSYLPSSK